MSACAKTDLDLTLKELFQRQVYGVKPSLEVITALLERLGNPQKKFGIIHLAGTNGKGSVCALVESVLRHSGLRTGLYTSPHLLSVNERFRVAGKMISDAELAALLGEINALAVELEKEADLRPATFFEVTTALAFEYFRRSGVQLAVMETGLGGRWDATNPVLPIIALITRIDLEHLNFLGGNLREIAAEKAGIIKPKRPVVIGAMPDEARKVLLARAKKLRAPLLEVEDLVSVRLLDPEGTHQKVKIESCERSYPPVELPLSGSHQRENTALAVLALERIGEILEIDLDIKNGLEKVFWPARFQLIQSSPRVVLDGAHNPSAARALVETLRESFPDCEIGFLLGFLKDKDATGFMRSIARMANFCRLAQLESERAMPLKEISDCARRAGLKGRSASVDSALSDLLSWASDSDKRIACIAGSLRWAEMLSARGWNIISEEQSSHG